jgi:sigma-B regulation protein RsbU (phosphoserine phosphatase)
MAPDLSPTLAARERDPCVDAPPPDTRLRVISQAAAVLSAVVGTAQFIELFINRVLRPDLDEWTWISDVLMVAGLLVMTAQWTRLRLARTAIADLERERLTIRTELAVAAKVQRALLPLIPGPAHGITWHAVMEPAGEIGGDYYDFFPLGDERMCVVLADVSGKGVPAAVFVSNTRAVLRAIAREGRPAPAGVLAAVSDMLLLDGRSDLYVTCVVAMVDLRQRTMVYANAGHPPGVLLSSGGGTRALGVGGPPLGLFPGAHYDEEPVTLESGDLVVLVSDGITDEIDAGGDGIPAALCAELTNLSEMTPQRACTALLDTARRSPGPRGVTTWADDRTVVAFAFVREPSGS